MLVRLKKKTSKKSQEVYRPIKKNILIFNNNINKNFNNFFYWSPLEFQFKKSPNFSIQYVQLIYIYTIF